MCEAENRQFVKCVAFGTLNGGQSSEMQRSLTCFVYLSCLFFRATFKSVCSDNQSEDLFVPRVPLCCFNMKYCLHVL